MNIILLGVKRDEFNMLKFNYIINNITLNLFFFLKLCYNIMKLRDGYAEKK